MALSPTSSHGSGSGGSSLLASFVQTAGTNVTTTSATQADVDATNAAITFTAPASGIVLVRATCEGQISTAAQLGRLGLREGAADIAGPHNVWQGNASFGGVMLLTPVWKLSGISAGAHTYKLAYAVSGGASWTIHQIASSAVDFPIVLEVWSA